MQRLTKWQATAPDELHIHAWDNEVVVYDALSGNTHLLDAVAAQVLQSIAMAPADTAGIAQMLAELWRESPAEQAHAQVDAILAELAGISLITAVTP